jgi:hypothetical protein
MSELLHEDPVTIEEPKNAGRPVTPNRQGEYAKMVVLLPNAFEKLKVLIESRNESVALGAVKIVMDKCLPNLKSIEVGGAEGGPIQLNIIAGNGFIPRPVTFDAPSVRGTIQQSTEIQDSGVAQTSEENDDSNNRAGEASAS